MASVVVVGAQTPPPRPVPEVSAAAAQTSGPTQPIAAGAGIPAEYVIGPEDVVGVHFWKDAEMTGDYAVRPDGRITLPLLGDIAAAGLTPEALKEVIQKAASKYQQDPSVTIIIRQINSRKVYITGEVQTPGAHPLAGPRTVMQLIALAGGLTEYADKKNITVSRVENGKPSVFKFNYEEFSKGKRLEQNILLKPGDVVTVR
jgi:polysaccharide export outer membrane protein